MFDKSYCRFGLACVSLPVETLALKDSTPSITWGSFLFLKNVLFWAESEGFRFNIEQTISVLFPTTNWSSTRWTCYNANSDSGSVSVVCVGRPLWSPHWDSQFGNLQVASMVPPAFSWTLGLPAHCYTPKWLRLPTEPLTNRGNTFTHENHSFFSF